MDTWIDGSIDRSLHTIIVRDIDRYTNSYLDVQIHIDRFIRQIEINRYENKNRYRYEDIQKEILRHKDRYIEIELKRQKKQRQRYTDRDIEIYKIKIETQRQRYRERDRKIEIKIQRQRHRDKYIEIERQRTSIEKQRYRHKEI